MKINLIFFKDNKSENGNFGDELSKFIVESLINKEKYDLVYNQNNIPTNIMCIGSYIHVAKNDSYIFGSGVRTRNNIEGGHKYSNLNVCAVRGPLTKKFLENRNIAVPDIYGDPALLLPRFYKPIIDSSLKTKIGLVPHKSNYSKYCHTQSKIDTSVYHLINPTDKWESVINKICSCKAVVSSSLHGLICSDAYNIPNLWLDEYKLMEGEFKFKDYFESQNRKYVKVTSINQIEDGIFYDKGNIIDLEKLVECFPFN
jgi:pyruvyltransferase